MTATPPQPVQPPGQPPGRVVPSWYQEAVAAPALLTTGDAARCLQVSPRTVNAWLTAGKLRGVRTPGGHWRVPADALEEAAVAMDAAGDKPSSETPALNNHSRR